MMCRAAEGSILRTWLRVVAAIVDHHSGAVGVVQPRKRAASERNWAWVLRLPNAIGTAHWANEAWVLDPPDSYAKGEEQGDEARESERTTLEPASSGGRKQAGAAKPTPPGLLGKGAAPAAKSTAASAAGTAIATATVSGTGVSGAAEARETVR